jgi:hypothetical protein
VVDSEKFCGRHAGPSHVRVQEYGEQLRIRRVPFLSHALGEIGFAIRPESARK